MTWKIRPTNFRSSIRINTKDAVMSNRTEQWPQANTKAPAADRKPEQGKCKGQESKELAGKTPGDRGMCEKATDVQGSE